MYKCSACGIGQLEEPSVFWKILKYPRVKDKKKEDSKSYGVKSCEVLLIPVCKMY